MALTAQDEALVSLARDRGLLDDAGLRRALGAVPDNGDSLANTLATQGFHGPALADLLRTLALLRFCCGPCPPKSYAELEQLTTLRCPSCQRALEPVGPEDPACPVSGRPQAEIRETSTSEQKTVGPYRVVRELGRGANGVVYLAKREDLPREYALKVVLDPDSHTLARFELEARVASKLDHPGIVPVLDAGRRGGQVYYAMEFCPGRTLQDRLSEGPIPAEEAASLLAKVARAVDHAHQEGVLHRDLKPANVILSRDGPRLTDFGLARDRSLRRSLTASGDLMGTPAYMSPEQWRGQRDIDARADVYALGVILYHCLAGQRPFLAETVTTLGEQVVRGDSVPLRRVARDVPTGIELICARAMAHLRRDRFRSAGDLAQALEAFAQGAPAPKELAPPPSGASSQAVTVLSLAALLLAGALALVGLALRRNAPDPVVVSAPEETPEPAASEAPPAPPLSPARLVELAGWAIQPFKSVRTNNDRRDGPRSLRLELPTLLARHPESLDLQALDSFMGLSDQSADPVATLRRLRAHVRGGVRQEIVALTARLALELGFHRLACDLTRPAATLSLEHPWFGFTALQIHMLASDPFRDVELSCSMAKNTIDMLERSKQIKALDHQPAGWWVYGHLATSQLHLGRNAEAVASMTAATDLVEGALGPEFDSLPGLMRDGALTSREAFSKLVIGLPIGRFLIDLYDAGGSSQWCGRPTRAAERTLGVFTDDPAQRAVVLLRAARLLEPEDPARAGQLLEEAVGLELTPELRLLASRQLARWLLARGEAPARAVELALASDPEALLSSGEEADGWILVARGRQQLGDESGALEALAAAEAAQPGDRRELEATALELR